MAMAEVVTMDSKANADKQKALDSALAQIERQFGKGSIMKLGGENVLPEIEATSTGSLGLDIALGIGGLPKGRVIEIYGPESSGKTTLTLHCVAEEQKKGGVCAFVDAEHALDPQYAKKLVSGKPMRKIAATTVSKAAAIGLRRRHLHVLGTLRLKRRRVALLERLSGSARRGQLLP